MIGMRYILTVFKTDLSKMLNQYKLLDFKLGLCKK